MTKLTQFFRSFKKFGLWRKK